MMPDVKVYTKVGGEELLWDRLPKIVAEQMSCYLPSGPNTAWRKIEYYHLDPEKEIDLFVILCDWPGDDIVQLRSKSDVIIEIAAYDFPDRMRNIDGRIKNIATSVKEMLGNTHKVSITFIPVQQRCWATV